MTTLTAPLLAQIMGCSQDRAAECFNSMVSAMKAFNITTPNRIRQFLTQVRWESGGLRYFAEIASGTAYNGRGDLGNTQPGDGPRYKGSGPIQVTGRSNFTAANKALHDTGVLPASVDIVADPDQARTVKYGFTISAWWWEAHGGNTVADDSDQDRAAVRCGRLVNRGNANSQYQAQDEAARLDAYRKVRGFGDLALPGSVPAPPVNPTPAPPSPEEDDDMSAADVQKILDDASKGRQWLKDQLTAQIRAEVNDAEKRIIQDLRAQIADRRNK